MVFLNTMFDALIIESDCQFRNTNKEFDLEWRNRRNIILWLLIRYGLWVKFYKNIFSLLESWLINCAKMKRKLTKEYPPSKVCIMSGHYFVSLCFKQMNSYKIQDDLHKAFTLLWFLQNFDACLNWSCDEPPNYYLIL